MWFPFTIRPIRALTVLLLIVVLDGCLAGNSVTSAGVGDSSALRQTSSGSLQSNSLCATDEQIIFSCAVKRSAKIVSLCGSRQLTRERGYLQYRFGLPGKVELEFPKDHHATQQQFHYSHYFRFQVDLTEIKFQIEGYEYSIFDDYNGEEKPASSTQGVTVTAPGKSSDVSFVCRSKPKADYSSLQDVLGNESQ